MARVNSQLRRYTNLGNFPQAASDDEICLDQLVINKTSHVVTVDGKKVKLTL